MDEWCSTTDLATMLPAAALAGLVASGHCAAMCGGVAGALAVRHRAATPGRRLALAAVYNLSRIGSYAVAGALAGVAGLTLLSAVDVAALAVVFRVLSGAIMVAVAGRLLFGWRLLDPLEAAGAALWRRVAPVAARPGAGELGSALRLGLAWGALPCGMTYSMLLVAATTANPWLGAGVMLAFGAGTLPSMTAAVLFFDRAAGLASRRASWRTVAGTVLLVAGLWTAGYALWHAGGAHHHHGAAPGTAPSPASEPATGHEHHH
ncbi:MAG: sulfite exporter TauE/SafE family protein [Steroidobacteraceae bacterium]